MLQICDGAFVSPSSQAIIQNPQRLGQWWSPHWTSIFSLSRILEHKLTWHHICNGNHWFPQWMIAVTRTCWKVPTQIIILELGFFVFFFFNWDGEISQYSRKMSWKVEMLHRLDAEALRWGALLHLTLPQSHAHGQRAHWSQPQFSLESNTAYCWLTSETATGLASRGRLVMWVMFHP